MENTNEFIAIKIKNIESEVNTSLFENRDYRNQLTDNKLSVPNPLKKVFKNSKYIYTYKHHTWHLFYVDENYFHFQLTIDMNRARNKLVSFLKIEGVNFKYYINTGKIYTDGHCFLQEAINDYITTIPQKLEYIEKNIISDLLHVYGKSSTDFTPEEFITTIIDGLVVSIKA